MPPLRRAKVLVAGGGPAGATAAALLASSGADVLLAERDLSFRKPCGGGVPAQAFREFGIPIAIARHRISSFRLVAPSGGHVDIPLADQLYIVDRPEFDAHLRSAARAAGAEVIEAEVRSVEKTRAGHRVTMLQDGREVACEAEYIIAADGVNSRIRTLFLKDDPANARFAVTERIEGQETDRCEFWFSRSFAPGTYAWIFPSEGGVGIGTGSFEGRSLPDCLARFRERAGIGGKAADRRMYRIPVWEDGPYRQGRTLVCGDAAGQVMPLSSEGVYYAMKAGSYAAQAVLEGAPGEYRRRWRAEFSRVFGIAAKLEAFFLRDDASAERLVNLHRRPEVQEIAQDLWLLKRHRGRRMLHYLKLIGRLFA